MEYQTWFNKRNSKSFYVDSQAVGDNTGASWVNAWKSLSDINFGVMKSGATLFISGGTYLGTIKIPPGTVGITITKSLDAGHDGEVVMEGSGSLQNGININAEKIPVKNILISELTFHNYVWAGVYGSGQNSGGLQGIVVDKCKFLDFNRAGVFFEGNNNLKNNFGLVVKNSYFDDNNAGVGQSDGIYVQVLRDFTADHNIIILDNNYIGVADLHSDNIQAFWVDKITYSNNIVIQKSDKTFGTQLLFTENGYGEHLFLNNILIRNTPHAVDSGIRIKSAGNSTNTAKIFGNTYYGFGAILNSSVVAVIENNILYGVGQSSPSISMIRTKAGSVVKNNLYYDPNKKFPPTKSGGIAADPMFVNTDFENLDLYLQSGSPAIDGGSVLEAVYGLDITGISRNLSWDIGAYEFAKNQ